MFTTSWSSFFPPLCGCLLEPREEGVREQHERHVPVPALPRTYLILVEPPLSLGLFQALLHRPAGTGNLH
jgi:hypothetical protein